MRLRERNVRSPLPVSVAEVCGPRGCAPEVLCSTAAAEEPPGAALSSRVECSPCCAEDSKICEEDVDKDSESLLSSSAVLPPVDCCTESENWVKTSSYEAELAVTSADVLLLVKNQCAVLSPPLMEGTDLDTVSV